MLDDLSVAKDSRTDEVHSYATALQLMGPVLLAAVAARMNEFCTGMVRKYAAPATSGEGELRHKEPPWHLKTN